MAGDKTTEEDEQIIDPDDPHLQANQERVKNHLYRAIHTGEVNITAKDVELIHDGFDTLSDDEIMEFAALAIELETEVFEGGRDGMGFMEISETEQEYFRFLEKMLDRVR